MINRFLWFSFLFGGEGGKAFGTKADRKRKRKREREIDRETEKQAGKQAGRMTDRTQRQTRRERERERDRHGETETPLAFTSLRGVTPEGKIFFYKNIFVSKVEPFWFSSCRTCRVLTW